MHCCSHLQFIRNPLTSGVSFSRLQMFRTHILWSHALVFLVKNISDVIGYFVNSIASSTTDFSFPGNENPCNFNDGGLRLMSSPLEWQLCSKWNCGTFSFSFSNASLTLLILAFIHLSERETSTNS